MIKEYSKRLTLELGKKFNITLLKNIRQFYLISQKGPTLSDKLSWSHYVELLYLKNNNAINYYMKIALEQNLSVRELRAKIKNNVYERLDDKTKEKLVNIEELLLQDFIKNPILIKNSYDYDYISEKILKRLILEDIDSFLKELGDGFCYIENDYKIKLGEICFYITSCIIATVLLNSRLQN